MSRRAAILVALPDLKAALRAVRSTEQRLRRRRIGGLRSARWVRLVLTQSAGDRGLLEIVGGDESHQICLHLEAHQIVPGTVDLVLSVSHLEAAVRRFGRRGLLELLLGEDGMEVRHREGARGRPARAARTRFTLKPLRASIGSDVDGVMMARWPLPERLLLRMSAGALTGALGRCASTASPKEGQRGEHLVRLKLLQNDSLQIGACDGAHWHVEHMSHSNEAPPSEFDECELSLHRDAALAVASHFRHDREITIYCDPNRLAFVGDGRGSSTPGVRARSLIATRFNPSVPLPMPALRGAESFLDVGRDELLGALHRLLIVGDRVEFIFGGKRSDAVIRTDSAAGASAEEVIDSVAQVSVSTTAASVSGTPLRDVVMLALPGVLRLVFHAESGLLSVLSRAQTEDTPHTLRWILPMRCLIPPIDVDQEF